MARQIRARTSPQNLSSPDIIQTLVGVNRTGISGTANIPSSTALRHAPNRFEALDDDTDRDNDSAIEEIDNKSSTIIIDLVSAGIFR